MKNLKLGRAIVFLDLETTGTDPASDRIVEISLLRVNPEGARETRTLRINPERPIPPEATAVHGIRDEDVGKAPTFREVAPTILAFLADADLGGFNVQRFDLPLLDRELRACGHDLGLERRRVLDAMAVFHRKEPRDLAAAVRFYLGREHAGAHAAEADVLAAAQVLDAQIGRYDDLPRTVDELDRWCRPARPGAADRSGKFVWEKGQVVFSFGKHSGRTLREVARGQRDYLEWILRTDFPADARRMVERALDGEFPQPPDGERTPGSEPC